MAEDDGGGSRPHGKKATQQDQISLSTTIRATYLETLPSGVKPKEYALKVPDSTKPKGLNGLLIHQDGNSSEEVPDPTKPKEFRKPHRQMYWYNSEPTKKLKLTLPSGDIDKVRSLSEQGTDPNESDVWSVTTREGHSDIAKILLDKGANPKESEHVAKKVRLTTGNDQLMPSTQNEVDMVPLPELAREEREDKKDIARFIDAVQEGNGADLRAFEALLQNRNFDLENFPVSPLLIVAAFGSSETIEYVNRWSSTTFNWNSPLEIPAGVFEGILDKIKDRKATPLYVATFLKKPLTTECLIKYSDEKNIVYCMNNLQLSNSMEQIFMVEVGERLKIEYSDLKPAVVPGHKKEANGTCARAFVIYSPEVIRAKNEVKEGIGMVMLRNPYKVDKEAMTVSESKYVHCEISKQDMDKAKHAIESHSKTLWCDHSNLNIISVCSVRSKRKAAILTKGMCVVLYCNTKGVIPLGEKEFPTRLTYGQNNSIDIDVREGYFEYGGYDTEPSSSRHETLKMGCNIGVMAPQVQNSGGTLGPFVRYKGDICFLTCAHVLFDNAPQGKVDFTYDGSHCIDVVQPASDTCKSGGAPCGFIQRAIFNPSVNPSIDVAVVTISDASRLPTKGRFANDHSYKFKAAGFDKLPEYNNGNRVLNIQHFGTSNMVVQFGSETHLSKGYLVVDGTQVRPLSTVLGLPSGKALFCMSSQYEVEGVRSGINFFMPGDSGSAVFMLDGTSLHCIGMAIGHTSTGNAVVTPIAALLDALASNGDIDLLVFP